MCSVVVLGMAGVVVVFCFLLAMTFGLQAAIVKTGSTDRAIVLRRGSETEITSALSRAEVDLISNAGEIAVAPGRSPLVSQEIVRSLYLTARDSQVPLNFPIRGVGANHRLVRPEFGIESGREFTPGAYELIVGKQVRERAAGLNVGDHIDIRGVAWQVVGTFSAAGDAHESEIFADADTLQSLYQLPTVNAVTVKLIAAQAFEAFREALESNPSLGVVARREIDYYEAQLGQATVLLRAVALVVGTLLALGAVFAAANAMYSAVNARRREIGVLRALGFGNASMLGALLIESMLLALCGALIGVAVTYFLFHGSSISTFAGNGLNQLAFQLQLSAAILAQAFAGSMLIGAIGAVAPAIRAIRMPIDRALQVS